MEKSIFNFLDQELGDLTGVLYIPKSIEQIYWKWNDGKGQCHYISNSTGIIACLSFRHHYIEKFIPIWHPLLLILIKEYFEIQWNKENV